MSTLSPAPTIPRYISPRQLQELLGLSEPTIWRMRQRGELPEPIRLSPGRVGWSEETIRQFIASREAR
jgi:prophage regulatory protein